MTRVPTAVALLALAQSGIHVQPATLRQWVRRGHVTRTPDGYCVHEIRLYLERRDTRERAA